MCGRPGRRKAGAKARACGKFHVISHRCHCRQPVVTDFRHKPDWADGRLKSMSHRWSEGGRSNMFVSVRMTGLQDSEKLSSEAPQGPPSLEWWLSTFLTLRPLDILNHSVAT